MLLSINTCNENFQAEDTVVTLSCQSNDYFIGDQSTTHI